MKQVINFNKEVSTSDIIYKINNLITIEADNIWFIHLRNIYKNFSNNDNENILGKTENDSFIIWQYNSYWGGIFYPIILGKILNQKDKLQLEIKTKLNICGKFFSIFIFLIMLAVFLYHNIQIINNKIYFSTRDFFILGAVCIIFQSVSFAAYNLTRVQTIKFIKNYLKMD